MLWTIALGWQKSNWHAVSIAMSAACYVKLQHHDGNVGLTAHYRQFVDGLM